MEIRKLDKNNQNEMHNLSSFITKALSENNDLIARLNNSISAKHHKDIYSVQIDDDILAIASTHKSTWHPYCIYVQVAFDLNEIKEQALQILIAELRYKYDQPLFFLLDARFHGLIEILTRNQFKMIRQTDIIHIEPPVQKGETVQGVLIFPIKEIRTNEEIMESLVKLCKKVYTETHTDNPVADLSIESWKHAAMDGLLEEHSYVMVDGLDVTAFSLIYEFDEKTWELGWVGVEDLSRIVDLDKLIDKQVEDALEHNISFIEKEVDSTCPYSLHICKAVKYEVADTLYAYIK